MIYLIIHSDNIVDAYLIQEKFERFKPEIVYKNKTVNVLGKRRLRKTYMTTFTMEKKNERVHDTVR